MTILIVPGLDGAGPGHWQDWWLNNDPNAVMVQQRDWRRPETWAERLIQAVRDYPYAWLVAHGAGALLVAKVAAERLDLGIAGALLVAPSDAEAPGTRLAALAPISLAPLPFPAAVVASRTDPLMRFRRARTFADAWGARLIDYDAAGHINATAGFGPWPDGPRLLAGLRPRRPLAPPPESGRSHSGGHPCASPILPPGR
jgi:predicted alpha/beta hydrolase family esterase